jgi:hypothetical protein
VGYVQGLYLLLVTNKASNILEDLETLRLLSKVILHFTLLFPSSSMPQAESSPLLGSDQIPAATLARCTDAWSTSCPWWKSSKPSTVDIDLHHLDLWHVGRMVAESPHLDI